MLIEAKKEGERLNLNSPTALPYASAFLWNKCMMIHLNCRGYAVAQFMQPEPAKYAHAPNLEAKSFMQPEQPFYTHHPGRFCYVKDEESSLLFSVPYEPVRSEVDSFTFSAGKSDIHWNIEKDGVMIEMSLSLTIEEPIELWSVTIRNTSDKAKKLSVYPYFPVGYMSWMNQSGVYDADLRAIICTSISPYQKYQDYENIKKLKDKTYLISDMEPASWEVNQAAFEGEGGLHHPSGVQQEELSRVDARYEIPACIMQYRLSLDAGQEQKIRLLFGPAKDDDEIRNIRHRYFAEKNSAGLDGFEQSQMEYSDYIKEGKACIIIKTPDPNFDNFINNWLPRQIYYHGITNRLCTDPQTRNFLQDNMGMSYIKPRVAKRAFLNALSQQNEDGEMPEGILIHEEAELKYINQVPHTDHCAWLPICIKAYLDETNDFGFLNEKVPFAKGEVASVSEHMHRAMKWLSENKDERGLSYINQGDWNDPMNMVGHKGKGVSGWLSMATSYALQLWADICELNGDLSHVDAFRSQAEKINGYINKYLWDGSWYARGITDDNVVFGVSEDKEGRIFLNTQSWAFLCGCADDSKIKKMLEAIETHLETAFGVELITPAYTEMREDVGRVTQKHPGYAENGSVYNHAVAFYIYGLYKIGEADRAYRLMRKMIPGPDEKDLLQRGQLPVFIPNYYRGASSRFPRTAGRSSQLFNTGTVHWLYRCLIDGLFGLRGTRDGLLIAPNLPLKWNEVFVIRYYQGAEFNIKITRIPGILNNIVTVDGVILEQPLITEVLPGMSYDIEVKIPLRGN